MVKIILPVGVLFCLAFEQQQPRQCPRLINNQLFFDKIIIDLSKYLGFEDAIKFVYFQINMINISHDNNQQIKT